MTPRLTKVQWLICVIACWASRRIYECDAAAQHRAALRDLVNARGTPAYNEAACVGVPPLQRHLWPLGGYITDLGSPRVRRGESALGSPHSPPESAPRIGSSCSYAASRSSEWLESWTPFRLANSHDAKQREKVRATRRRSPPRRRPVTAASAWILAKLRRAHDLRRESPWHTPGCGQHPGAAVSSAAVLPESRWLAKKKDGTLSDACGATVSLNCDAHPLTTEFGVRTARHLARPEQSGCAGTRGWRRWRQRVQCRRIRQARLRGEPKGHA